MREMRTSGSEGGGPSGLPTPIGDGAMTAEHPHQRGTAADWERQAVGHGGPALRSHARLNSGSSRESSGLGAPGGRTRRSGDGLFS